MSLQSSMASRLTLASSSAQSVPQTGSPPGCALQQLSSTDPSPSTSVVPNVSGLQSSSLSSASQISCFPGNRPPSRSSQSAPPHWVASTPSSSWSLTVQSKKQRSLASVQNSCAPQGESPLRQPVSGSPPLSAQVSMPLQNLPSSQSTSFLHSEKAHLFRSSRQAFPLPHWGGTPAMQP